MLVINEHILVLYSMMNASDPLSPSPLVQVTVIIDTEVESSTDKGHVVVDATPDSFRENMIWAMLFFEQLDLYIVRSYYCNPDLDVNGVQDISIVEEHLLSP